MSATSDNISTQIMADTNNEENLLKYLARYPSHSPELLATDLKLSPLVLALYRNFDNVAAEIIKKLTPEQFVKSFRYKHDNEAQQKARELFPRILELDITVLPKNITSMVEDFKIRKMLALLTGITGTSHFHDIPWTLEGHHNYLYINKILFELIINNQKEIIQSLETKLKALLLTDAEMVLLKKIINKTITTLYNLPQRSSNSKIIPMLVGTVAGNNFLHAEGFVWYDPKYLVVERSNSSNSGIDIFEVSAEFNRKDFVDFLSKAQKSIQGFETALSYEYYAEQTTANGHFKKIGHIDMIPQDPKNCPTASPEGIFLATLYCELLENNFDIKLSEKYAYQLSILIFETNKNLELEKFKKLATTKNDNDLMTFYKQIEEWLKQKPSVGSAATAAAGSVGSITAGTEPAGPNQADIKIKMSTVLSKTDYGSRDVSPPEILQPYKNYIKVTEEESEAEFLAKKTQEAKAKADEQKKSAAALNPARIDIRGSASAPLLPKADSTHKSDASNNRNWFSWLWNKCCASQPSTKKSNNHEEDDDKSPRLPRFK